LGTEPEEEWAGLADDFEQRWPIGGFDLELHC